MSKSAELTPQIIMELNQSGMSYREIGEQYGLSKNAVSQRMKRHNAKRRAGKINALDAITNQQQNAPTATISGVSVAEQIIDGAEVWERAIRVSQRKIEPRNYTINFDRFPVCIVQMADLHIGSSGVDYERLHREIEIVQNTDGMFFGLIGDIADNMIVGRLAHIRAMKAEFTMSEEWAMVDYALGLIGDKLLYSIAGNHDLWTLSAGVDQLQTLHQKRNNQAIYERYDATITIGGCEYEPVIRARHDWRGNSQYNPTHAIEKAAKFDKGRAFDIGVGGHTHVSGLCREFNNGGQTGLAVLCGSYKRSDDYAAKLGVPEANEATAVATIIRADGSVWGTSNLEAAADYMRQVY